MLNHRRTLFVVAAVITFVMLVRIWPQHRFTEVQMTDQHKKALELIGSADALRQQSRVPESLEAAREAIRLMESARDAGNLDDARQLHVAYAVVGVTLAQNHRDEESVEWFEKALAAYEEEHPFGGNHRDLAQLASLRHNYAAALTQLDPTQRAARTPRGESQGYAGTPLGDDLEDRTPIRSRGRQDRSHQEHVPRGDGSSSTGSERGLAIRSKKCTLDHKRGANAPATILQGDEPHNQRSGVVSCPSASLCLVDDDQLMINCPVVQD